MLLAGALAACPGPEPEASSDAGARYPDAEVMTAMRRDAGRKDGTAEEEDGGTLDMGIDSNGDGGPAARYTWTQDIQPIVVSRCGLCHSQPPKFGAPRSLVSYSDMKALNMYGQPIHEVATYRIVAGTMPPAGQPMMTAEEKVKFRAWSEAGAPEGPVVDGGLVDAGTPDAAETGDAGVYLPWLDGGVSPSPGAGRRVIDVFAHDATNRTMPYVVHRNGFGASYICFSVTIPPNPSGRAESAVYFEPYLDNISHVHHLFVYHDQRAENADGPFECLMNNSQGRIIGSWFPGRGPTTLPQGTGVPVTAGQRFTLEVHYDSVPAEGAPDMSGMAITLTDEPNLTPAGEVWAGVSWTNVLSGPGPVTVQSTSVSQYDDVTLFTATPHMHSRGLHISLEYARAAAPNQWMTIVDNQWDFTNQVLFPLDPPVHINRGDMLRTTCTWTTAQGPIRQGASTDQEMCYIFMYHYRAQLLPFSAFVGPAQ